MKYLYKIFIIKLFEIIYGKIYRLKKKDNKKLKITNLNFYKKNYKLYEVDKGRIFTDCNTNVAYISKNNQINNFSYQQNKDKISSIKYNSVLKIGTPKLKKIFKGKVFSLIQGASGNNYWHWLFDLLPKIEILYINKMINRFDYFYIPKIDNYIIDTLKIYGIKKKQLINSQKYKHIEADTISVLENIYLKSGGFHKQFKNIPLNIVKKIRNRLIKYKSRKFNNKKIFIDRSDSKFNHYQFFENDKIIKILKKKNFAIFKLSKLSIFDQISLFNSSKLILGLHGAGFANIIFCKKKTKIYEILKKKDSKRNAFKTLSNHSSLKHTKIIINKYKKIDGYDQLIFDKKYFDLF
jgi:capsular polysaccharide biosynthesis protein